MSTEIPRQAMATQTLYAELLEQLTALEAHRSIGHLSGCFVSKKVKNDHYYYFQYSEPGGATRQIYVGKKSPQLDRIVETHQRERVLVKGDESQIKQLCAQLRAGGALVTDVVSARVLRALAEGGVFLRNGVLVGTHAFTVLGNMLGVQWQHAALKTQDVDIAGDDTLLVALPDQASKVPEIIENLQMGFLPVPALNPKNPSTSFKVRGKALRVDILTSASSRHSSKPIFLKNFGVAAQPLAYLDFLMVDCVPGAVVNGAGILVNVPQPARFAFHKLIAAHKRPVTMQAKSTKDVDQARQVLTVLLRERPGDIQLAWQALKKRRDGMIGAVRKGLKNLSKKDAALNDSLRELLKI